MHWRKHPDHIRASLKMPKIFIIETKEPISFLKMSNKYKSSFK